MVRIAWQMTRLNLLRIWRDKRALFLLFGMPLVLTSILSFALGSVFGGNAIPKFTVAVYNADHGPLGIRLADFLAGQKKQLDVIQTGSLNAARELSANGRAAVVVAIPADYSSEFQSGRQTSVNVEASENHLTDLSIVRAMINTYGERIGDMKYIAGQAKPGSALSAPARVRFLGVMVGLHPVTAGSYYAIGMMVLFLLSHAITRSSSMIRERDSDCYRRIVASPSSRYAIAFGHWLANFLVLFVQGVILLTCAKYLLSLRLGPVPQIALLLSAYCASLAGIAVLIGSWATNLQIVDVLGGIGANIAVVLGGSIFPVYNFPRVMQWVAHALPNRLAVTTLVDSVSGIATADLAVPVVYLVGMGVLFGWIASLRYGRPA